MRSGKKSDRNKSSLNLTEGAQSCQDSIIPVLREKDQGLEGLADTAKEVSVTEPHAMTWTGKPKSETIAPGVASVRVTVRVAVAVVAGDWDEVSAEGRDGGPAPVCGIVHCRTDPIPNNQTSGTKIKTAEQRQPETEE